MWVETQCNSLVRRLAPRLDRGAVSVFILGTTTHPERIDPSVLSAGRLAYSVSIPLPEQKQRIELLRHFLDGVAKDSELLDPGFLDEVAFDMVCLYLWLALTMGSGPSRQKNVTLARARARVCVCVCGVSLVHSVRTGSDDPSSMDS